MQALRAQGGLCRLARPQARASTVPVKPALFPGIGCRMRNVHMKASVDTTESKPSDEQKDEDGRPLFATMSSDEEEANVEGDCDVYIDRDGNIVEVMCCDYGYRSGVERMYDNENEGAIPTSGISLAWKNFTVELASLRRSFRYDEYQKASALNPPAGAVGQALYRVGEGVVQGLAAFDEKLESIKLLPPLEKAPHDKQAIDPETGDIRKECRELRAKLKQFKLSNDAVWAREHARERAGKAVETPWFVKGAYLALCLFLDVVFNNRPIQRFWFLETVARMPYFSYITCLHLYESLGWWRAAAELRKIHFAEEWNELHHLQIMESLGGDRLWIDRFMGYHSAVIYYWVLVALFIVSPALAYNFSELIEAHAVDTYGEFADANKELLVTLPPPRVAVQYYSSADLYMYDEFRTSSVVERRTPETKNLYDVFINIRDDEGEHVKTMKACQDGSVTEDLQARREQPRRV